jgi:hypothetical protein
MSVDARKEKKIIWRSTRLKFIKALTMPVYMFQILYLSLLFGDLLFHVDLN